MDFYAIAKKTGWSNTALRFDTYLQAVAKECARLTEPKWSDNLGGVAGWTDEHCHQVVMALGRD